jgi:hypothetical protein
MEVVGGAESDQTALFVEELGIDVDEEDVFLVVELGDDPIVSGTIMLCCIRTPGSCLR